MPQDAHTDPGTNSYFVSTVGSAPLSIVKQYIENQKEPEGRLAHGAELRIPNLHERRASRGQRANVRLLSLRL